MLETADRLVAEEKQPSVQQFLLLVGGLRAMTAGERGAGPGARLLPAALAGGGRLRAVVRPTAPAAATRGPHRWFTPVGRRRAVRRLPGARLGVARRPATLEVLGALLAGDWPVVERRRPAPPARGLAAWSRRTCTGTSSAGCARWSTSSAEPPTPTKRAVRPPNPHPSGARPPDDPAGARARGTSRSPWTATAAGPRRAACRAPRATRRGEAALFDVVEGAIEIGVKAISAYAFSTENWTRSPDEVRFLMGFNRDVIRRRRDEMHELGVRVRWAGRAPRLWKSVISELQVAEELTRDNDVLTLDDVRQLRRPRRARRHRPLDRPRGRRRPARPGEGRREDLRPPPLRPRARRRRHGLAHVGEQRLSNFMLWQAAYAELVFTDVLWPDVDRLALWKAIEIYAQRDRRYGKA